MSHPQCSSSSALSLINGKQPEVKTVHTESSTPTLSPQQEILKFIKQKWSSEAHEKFLKFAEDDDRVIVPGLEHDEETGGSATFSVKSFFKHQKKIIDTLTDKQVKKLCNLIEIIQDGMKTLNCDDMIVDDVEGFWLNNEGSPVTFHLNLE
jgi:hypothetical protein